MNWKNVNLNNNYESDQNILDPISFNILLLEIECNLKDVNETTIEKHFKQKLQSNIVSAIEVF